MAVVADARSSPAAAVGPVDSIVVDLEEALADSTAVVPVDNTVVDLTPIDNMTVEVQRNLWFHRSLNDLAELRLVGCTISIANEVC